MKINPLMNNIQANPKNLKTHTIVQRDIENEGRSNKGLSDQKKDRIERLFEKYDRILKPSVYEEVKNFIISSPGCREEKYQTLEKALAQDVELTQERLEALHDSEQEPVFAQLPENGAGLNEKIKQRQLETIAKELKLPEETLSKIRSMLNQGFESQEIIKLLVDEGLIDLEFKTDQVVLDILESFIVQNTEKIKSSDSNFQEIDEKILDERIINALELVSDQLGLLVEDIRLSFDIKQFLIQETNAMTHEAKSEFTAFQSKSVDQLNLLLKELEKPSLSPVQKQDAEEKINQTIQQLRTLILKSNVTLFTDMYMERDLLKCASKLEMASEALAQGQFQQAKSMVKEIETTLGQMSFQPSIKRVQAFAHFKGEQFADYTRHTLKPEDAAPLNPKALLQKGLELFQNPEGVRQSKDIYETMRLIGHRHEVEVAESYEARQQAKNQHFFDQNIKSILLQLMKDSTESRQVESAEQSLFNLAGQDLSQQSDQRDQPPFYRFKHCFQNGEKIGEMSVYLTGRKARSQLDAHNAEMYFALKKDHQGDLGIRIKLARGLCDIEVVGKASQTLLANLEDVMAELPQWGYAKGQLTISESAPTEKMSKSQQNSVKEAIQNIEKKSLKQEDVKGFDFKI